MARQPRYHWRMEIMRPAGSPSAAISDGAMRTKPGVEVSSCWSKPNPSSFASVAQFRPGDSRRRTAGATANSPRASKSLHETWSTRRPAACAAWQKETARGDSGMERRVTGASLTDGDVTLVLIIVAHFVILV